MICCVFLNIIYLKIYKNKIFINKLLINIFFKNKKYFQMDLKPL